MIHNEDGVKRAVKKLLAQYGWFFWMPPANAFGRSGISDFHALRKGKFLAIETKYGYNKPTPLQQQFLKDVMRNDGYTLVVYEDTLDELEDFLRSM